MSNIFVNIYLLIICYEPDTTLGIRNKEKINLASCLHSSTLLKLLHSLQGMIFLRSKSDCNVPAHNSHWLPIASCLVTQCGFEPWHQRYLSCLISTLFSRTYIQCQPALLTSIPLYTWGLSLKHPSTLAASYSPSFLRSQTPILQELLQIPSPLPTPLPRHLTTSPASPVSVYLLESSVLWNLSVI